MISLSACWISKRKFNLRRQSALTEQSLVILWFSFEQAVNPLDWAKLYFHVCQVTHHPVHVVGHLIQEGRREEMSWVNVTTQTRSPFGVDIVVVFTQIQLEYPQCVSAFRDCHDEFSRPAFSETQKQNTWNKNILFPIYLKLLHFYSKNIPKKETNLHKNQPFLPFSIHNLYCG